MKSHSGNGDKNMAKANWKLIFLATTVSMHGDIDSCYLEEYFLNLSQIVLFDCDLR